MDQPVDDAFFSESQPFHQNLVARIAVPLVVLGAAGAMFAAGPSGGAPLVAVLAGVIIVVTSLLFMTLRTTVSATDLRFEMYPLLRRRLPIESIDEVEAVRYSPIREGGGWGIRFSPRYGLVVNVSGNRGVRVVAGRKRYLIGSRRADELAAAIEVAREHAMETAS